MSRVVEQRTGFALLDDLAVLHDVDPVGEPAHDAKIVGDEEHGHALVVLELGQQFQDLRLDCHVEGGRGLVGDQ